MRFERALTRMFNKIGNEYVSADYIAKELKQTRNKIECLVLYNPEKFDCIGVGDARKYRLKELNTDKKPRGTCVNKFMREVCYDFILIHDGCTLHELGTFLGMNPKYVAKVIYTDHRIRKEGHQLFAR